MSTTKQFTNKSAASSGMPTVGAMKIKATPPAPKKSKVKYSTKKYPESPTRNAKKVKKTADLDIKVARDLKFEFQGFGDALSGIKELADNLKNLNFIDPHRLNDAIDTLASVDAETLNNTISKIGKTTTDFDKVILRFKGMTEEICSDGNSAKIVGKNILFFSASVLSVVFFLESLSDKKHRNRGLALISLVVAMATTPDIIRGKVVPLLTKLFDRKVEFQSYIVPTTSIATLLSATLGAVTMMSCEKHYFVKFNEVLTHFDRKTSSIDSILKIVMTTCTGAINFALEKLGYDKIYTYDDTGNFIANDFIKDYNAIVKLCDKKKFPTNAANFDKIISLCDRAQNILIEARKNKESEGLLRVISTIHNKLLLKKEQFIASNFSLSGVRMEPVCIVLRGPPGVGKSQTILFLHAAICAFALEKDAREEAAIDPTKFMYNRQPENVYWDGYDPRHIVTVFDDFGQIRDVAGNPDCEYMNLIRAVNEFPAMLHMASMDKKSNSFFRSEFVIMTTNCDAHTLRAESINHMDAVYRRLHLCYDVSVRAEFATDGKIDADKLPRHPNGTIQCDPSILNFTRYDLERGTVTAAPIDFYELVDVVRDLWMVHKSRNAVKQFNLDSVMSRITKRYELQSGMSAISKYFTTEAIDMDTISEVSDESDEYANDPQEEFEREFIIVFNKYADRLNKIMGFDRRTTCLIVFDNILTGKEVSEILAPGVKPAAERSRFTTWRESLVHDPEAFCKYLENNKYLYLGLDDVDWEAAIMNDVELSKVHFWQTKSFKVVVSLASILTTGLSIWGVVRHFKGRSEKTKDVEVAEVGCGPDGIDANPQYGMKSPKGKTIRRVDFKTMQATLRAEKQSYFGHDTNGTRIVDKTIKRNLYRISVFNGESDDKIGFGLVVRGKTMLIPQHFVYQAAAFVEDDYDYAAHKVTFSLATKGPTDAAQQFFMTVAEFIAAAETGLFEGRDLAILRLPRYLSMHQDVVPYFLTNQDYERIKDWSVRLILAHEDAFENITSHGKPITTPILMEEIYEDAFALTTGIQYHGNTSKGDCGAPLVIVNSRLPKARFLGLHVAAYTAGGIGISSTVTREELESVFQAFPDDVELFEPEEFDTFDMPEMQSRFKPLYKVKLKQNSGNKTMIAKSEMYGYRGKVETAPSVLRPVVRIVDGHKIIIDPYDKALQKYCTSNFYYSPENVSIARDSVFEMLRRTSKIFVPGIYTFEQAVIGDVDDPFFNALSRSTSAGYPYSAMNLGRGKFYFFGNGEAYDLTTQQALQLKRDVEEILNKASQGIRLEHIFTDNLKDERRPLEKIESVSTRLFSGAPLPYTIAFRMMFGKFMSWYISNNISNGSAIGLNVYAADWDVLGKKMTSKANAASFCFGAGDYSAYDGSEKPFIHWAILDLMNDFYRDGSENARIRSILWHELVNSKHIRGDSVYSWPSSLPSGHPCTTIVNNLYNHIAFNLCWIQMGLPAFGEGSFYECVYLCTMGDDNIYAVDPLYASVFTEAAVGREMAKIGLKYTPETDKMAATSEGLRKLTEIAFLKRKFRWDTFTSSWVAPIDLKVIFDMPNWTKTNPELRSSITRDNVETALMELSLHGKQIYDLYATCMLSAYESTGLPPLRYVSYNANVNAVHNRLRYL